MSKGILKAQTSINSTFNILAHRLTLHLKSLWKPENLVLEPFLLRPWRVKRSLHTLLVCWLKWNEIM